MSMIVQMSLQSGVLRVTLKGEYVLEESQRNLVTIIEAMAREKMDKALVDAREVRGNPAFIDRYAYGQFAARTVTDAILCSALGGGARFAFVLTRPLFDPQSIGQLVAANRGMAFRVFDNLDLAEEWLEASTPLGVQCSSGELPVERARTLPSG